MNRLLYVMTLLYLCILNKNVNGKYADCNRDGLTTRALLKSLEKSLQYMAKNVKNLDADALFGVALTQGLLLNNVEPNNVNVEKCLMLTKYLLRHPRVDSLKNIPDVSELIYSPLIWIRSGNINKQLKCDNKNKDLPTRFVIEGNLQNTPNESQSDMCLSELARHMRRSKIYSTKIECQVSHDCRKALTGGTPWGYGLLHRILFNIIAVSVGCHPVNSNEKMCCKIFNELQTLEDHNIPLEMTDLFIEEVLICSLSGYRQFLRMDWIQQILKWQKSVGCWWDYVTLNNKSERYNSKYRTKRSTKLFGTDGCSTHTTGISIVLMTLATFHAPHC